jgi:hypothetical protein
MDTSKPFMITPRDLRTSTDELTIAVRRVAQCVPELVVQKENYHGGVVTVSLPEKHAQKTAELLGEHFILSPNTDLKLID